jgi:hypothetical protein
MVASNLMACSNSMDVQVNLLECVKFMCLHRDLSEMTIEARTEGKVMMVTEKGGEEMTGSAVKGLNALTEMSVVKEGSAAIGKVVTEEIGAIATGQ